MNIKPDSIEHIAFELCVEFIVAVNQRNFPLLQQKFAISDEVWDEIQTDVLAYYFPEHCPILMIAENIAVFEYDEGGWGLRLG